MKNIKNIIWLTEPNFFGALRSKLIHYLKEQSLGGMPLPFIHFISISGGLTKKVGKKSFSPDWSKKNIFENKLKKLSPDFIIINDPISLAFITNKYTSLALCRGGIYYWNGCPCLVVDNIMKTRTIKYGEYSLRNDINKLKKWINHGSAGAYAGKSLRAGKSRIEVPIDITICKNAADLENLKTIAGQRMKTILISCDIETFGSTISSISYSLLIVNGVNGFVKTFVIPLMNPTNPHGCYWKDENDEILVWNTIKSINNSKIPKTFQNGLYDNSYFIKYNVPCRNYIFDTMHLAHAFQQETPLRLDYLASIFLDYYCYWKDESKKKDPNVENTKDDKERRIPQTKEGLISYWMYNGIDSHNTLIITLKLIEKIVEDKNSWALFNYEKEMQLQTCASIWMTMTGIKEDSELKQKFYFYYSEKSRRALAELQTITDNSDFNPNSPKQVGELIYNILKAKPFRGKRKTDEHTLKLISSQHPLFFLIISKIWEVKKNKNNASKYGACKSLGGRFYYQISQPTETWRFKSSSHPFHLGTNAQNIPDKLRPFLRADDGYILFEIDYSGSDGYFSAYGTGDEKYIQLLENGKDPHCHHASFFFKIPYERIIEGKNNNEPWVMHETKGCRYLTKRLTYGANYFMKPTTLFIQLGRESVVAVSKFLGAKNAEKFDDKKLITVCDRILSAYHYLYSEMYQYINKGIVQTVQNENRWTNGFGYTRQFLENLLDAERSRNEFSAFIGQNGTAGNINEALINLFIKNGEIKQSMLAGELMIELQGHDSIIGQIRKNKIELLKKIQKEMLNECFLNGKSFTVPVETKVGIHWTGKQMLKYGPETTIKDIEDHDRMEIQRIENEIENFNY